MPKRIKVKGHLRKLPRKTRGRVIHSLARTTPKGRGRIKKRRSYKRNM